jgi:hypothetical protein
MNKTPFEAWHGKKPSVGHMKTFGCTAHVKLVGPNQTKLADRSKKMVFLGYEPGTKGYKLLDPDTMRLTVSRDVIFEENVPWDWSNVTGNGQDQLKTFTVEYEQPDRNPTIDIGQADSGSEGAVAGGGSVGQGGGNHPPSPHTPQSVHTPGEASTASAGHGNTNSPPTASSDEAWGGPVRYRNLSDILDSTDPILDYEYSAMCMLAADEPVSVEEALKHDCWKKAMKDELDAI